MKHFKRIAAVVLALAVVLVMSVMAFAASELPISEDTLGAKYTVTFKKEILAEGTGTIYAPNVTYKYDTRFIKTIEGSDTSTYPGVTVSDVTFGNGLSAADGTVISTDGYITVDTSSATAGVYQYSVTESSTNKTTNGITTEGNYQPTRYLIVVVNNDRVVTNAYLFTADDRDVSYKTEGWMASGGVDNYDLYETVDVTVEKVITGTYADPTHPFEFTFMVNCENGSKVTIEGADKLMKSSFTKFLASGDRAVIQNVPKNATSTLTVTEKNDTYNTYEVTTTNLETNLNRNEMVAGADAGGTTANITDNMTIRFTNNLPDLSPTGLVLRVAPYAIVVAAGAALVVVSRRRKENAC